MSELAEDGHVMQLHGGYDVFLRSGGDIEPKLVGVRKASTFPAFCAHHDASTFSPIEQGAYCPSEEHAFLASYRAVCRELFFFEAKERMNLLRDLDKGLPPAAQAFVQGLAAAKMEETRRALISLRLFKLSYDRALMVRDYSGMKFYSIEFDTAPDVMMTSMFAPYADFQGRRIRHQDILGTADDHLILSLFASGRTGWFQLAWLGDSQAGQEFTRSFAGLTNAEIPHAIIRLVFSDFENVFFRPSWWVSLSNEDQVYLHRRFWKREDPYQPAADDYLIEDGKRLVNWRVRARSGNVPFESPSR